MNSLTLWSPWAVRSPLTGTLLCLHLLQVNGWRSQWQNDNKHPPELILPLGHRQHMCTLRFDWISCMLNKLQQFDLVWFLTCPVLKLAAVKVLRYVKEKHIASAVSCFSSRTSTLNDALAFFFLLKPPSFISSRGHQPGAHWHQVTPLTTWVACRPVLKNSTAYWDEKSLWEMVASSLTWSVHSHRSVSFIRK